ncbi:MAG: bifunctional tetrahydrofolate synthase/dihydrofolate synthase [Pseudomonadota bacterium]
MSLPSKAAWLQTLEHRHPSAIDMGLERVGVVADRLAVRQFAAPVITVAGTNGKGSTVATLVAVGRAAGWRVAHYTSPHLVDFNERIGINGVLISDDELVLALNAVEAVRGDTSLTYFEHTTLAALHWFQQQVPDLIVLEVGLGGRLDAVNLVDATVVVITSVDLDHQEWLGNTIAEIAREKAGVMRLQRPVIFGEREPHAVLLAHARSLSAPVWIKGRDYDFTVHDFSEADSHWHWQGRDGWSLPNLPLPRVVCDNAATALAALQALSQVSALCIDAAAVCKGLPEAFVTGRLQRLPGLPEIWLDVGHNPHGARFLWQHLPKALPQQRTHAVFAMLQDKDVAGVIAASRAFVDRWWLAGLPGPRGLTAEQLAERVTTALGGSSATGSALVAGDVCTVSQYASVESALQAARQAAQGNDRIIVFGSFLTVSTVLSAGG